MFNPIIELETIVCHFLYSKRAICRSVDAAFAKGCTRDSYTAKRSIRMLLLRMPRFAVEAEFAVDGRQVSQRCTNGIITARTRTDLPTVFVV